MKLWVRIPTALVTFIRALPGWFRTRYLWILLLVPIVCGTIVYQLADANVMGWNDSATCKAMLEIAHPSLLAAGVLLALSGWAMTRNPSLVFLGLMCMFALGREIGGQGTSIILYIGLVGLITYGHANLRKIDTLLSSRFASSFMATGFVFYALSLLLDRGIIKRLGWLFTWDTSWRPPYSSQIEENFEAVGGAFLLFSVLVTLFLAARHQRKLAPTHDQLVRD